MPTLLEHLLKSKTLKCPKCGGDYELLGWGKDEYGDHQVLRCPRTPMLRSPDAKENVR